MTEQALFIFKNKQNLNIEDLEMIIRQVRDFMKTGVTSRQEDEM